MLPMDIDVNNNPHISYIKIESEMKGFILKYAFFNP